MPRSKKPTPARPPVEADPFAKPVLDYAHNLLVGTPLRQPDKRMLNSFGSVDLVEELIGRPKSSTRSRRNLLLDDDEENLGKRLRAFVRQDGSALREPRLPGRPVRANLDIFARLLGLQPHEVQVLVFLLAVHHSKKLRDLVEALGEVTLVQAAGYVAAATGLGREQVLRALDASRGKLVQSGLVHIEERIPCPCDLTNKLEIKPGVLDLVLTPGLDEGRLLGRFLPEAEASTLEWADFSAVEGPARLARNLLAGALRKRQRGVNLLLLGPTGTGKTELARLLGRDLGARLFCAGRADTEGESASATERLSSLLLGQKLLGGSGAILLFDELEDLFDWRWQGGLLGDRSVAKMSKQWFNLLLETNPVPTVWITNTVEGIDPAFLRRFTYAIEMRPLSARQRGRILERHLGEDHALSQADVEEVARRFEVSPAQLGTAVVASRLLSPDGKPDRESIEKLLAPVHRMLGGERAGVPCFDQASFRLEAISSSEDLLGIAGQLAGWRPGPGPGVSLCFYGPPGTGKSEYAKYLAHCMDRSIVYRRVSDILSMWVGGTERNIARAFDEAESEDALLLFDEADSFLRDRRSARHSWEATQVNEFLQRLEAHRGVVVCTTNLWTDLDEASLRRFVLKVEFGYLRPDQAAALFHAMFEGLLVGPPAAEEEAEIRRFLSRLARLAPGDLATVRRRVAALGTKPSALQALGLIEAEVRAKREGARAAGFQR